MSDTVTEPRFTPVRGSDDAPSVFNLGWLPDIDVFPELTEARAKYLRLSASFQAHGAREREIEREIDASQRRREQALSAAHLAGTSTDLQPEDASLARALAEAKAQSQAATTAFIAHINTCIALVVEHEDEWLGAIADYQQRIDAKVERLIAEATALRKRRGDQWRLEHWIARTGAATPAEHLPYSYIPAPPSGDPREEESRDRDAMLKSYGGDETLVTEEQGEALREKALAPADMPSEDVAFADLPDEELVDWLMSCGGFDGRQKPEPEFVIAAAQGEASMARRLLAAERMATGDNPRQAVVDGLGKIGGF